MSNRFIFLIVALFIVACSNASPSGGGFIEASVTYVNFAAGNQELVLQI